jgi:hypothetical protein
LLDGEATALSRKAVELALSGDPTALRLCLDRTVAPRGDRSVELSLPPIDGAADILGAIKAVADAVGRGGITPGEGFALSQMIESFLRAIDASDFDNRLRQLEDALKPVRLLPVRLLNVGRPAEKRYPTWDLSSSHTPDTAEDSKPTAESPLLLRSVATLQPRISAAERSRSLYFSLQKTAKTARSERGLGAGGRAASPAADKQLSGGKKAHAARQLRRTGRGGESPICRDDVRLMVQSEGEIKAVVDRVANFGREL